MSNLTPPIPMTNRHFLELTRSTALLKAENLELRRQLQDAQKSMEAMLQGVQQAVPQDGDLDDLRFFRAREPHIQSLIQSVAADVGIKRAMDALRRFAQQWIR